MVIPVRNHVSGRNPHPRHGRAAQRRVHLGRVPVLPLRLRLETPPNLTRRKQAGSIRCVRTQHPTHHRFASSTHLRYLSLLNSVRVEPRLALQARQRPSRHRALPPHLRHHQPAQGRALDPAQPILLRTEHQIGLQTHRVRLDRYSPPPVPRTRVARRVIEFARGGSRRDSPVRRQILRFDFLVGHERLQRHVVHRRPHDPPDHIGPPFEQPRTSLPETPVHPELQRFARASHFRPARGSIRGAGFRGVRDDGSDASDDVEPVAGGWPAQGRVGWETRGSRNGNIG